MMVQWDTYMATYLCRLGGTINNMMMPRGSNKQLCTTMDANAVLIIPAPKFFLLPKFCPTLRAYRYALLRTCVASTWCATSSGQLVPTCVWISHNLCIGTMGAATVKTLPWKKSLIGMDQVQWGESVGENQFMRGCSDLFPFAMFSMCCRRLLMHDSPFE